jgi:hypothetical protein
MAYDAEASKRYRKTEKGRASLRRHQLRVKLRKMGISRGSYEALLVEQRGVCAICKRPCEQNSRLAIDHDHATGRVRGLLCARCNIGLGYFLDDPLRLQAALEYLR